MLLSIGFTNLALNTPTSNSFFFKISLTSIAGFTSDPIAKIKPSLPSFIISPLPILILEGFALEPIAIDLGYLIATGPFL